ncbi:hypothetical protein [Nocardia nova]|nr:hypothetical protein [Nocardia nova]
MRDRALVSSVWLVNTDGLVSQQNIDDLGPSAVHTMDKIIR